MGRWEAKRKRGSENVSGQTSGQLGTRSPTIKGYRHTAATAPNWI
jgi:hypothetical protein